MINIQEMMESRKLYKIIRKDIQLQKNLLDGLNEIQIHNHWSSRGSHGRCRCSNHYFIE
jgi:hypothetical protein